VQEIIDEAVEEGVFAEAEIEQILEKDSRRCMHLEQKSKLTN
jgi:hypothetical protein